MGLENWLNEPWWCGTYDTVISTFIAGLFIYLLIYLFSDGPPSAVLPSSIYNLASLRVPLLKGGSFLGDSGDNHQ